MTHTNNNTQTNKSRNPLICI